MERRKLGLRFEVGEPIPEIGTDFQMNGFAGVYRVNIKRILSQRVHPNDGATLLEVEATKELIEEVPLDPTR